MTKPGVSIVVPSHNEDGNVAVLCEKIGEVLQQEAFEIIFVDDGSTDNTLQVIEELSRSHDNVKYLSFSRNFGHQAALRAGLKYAKGQAVVSMDADLQHPPSLLPEMIEKWLSGYQVVYTIRKDTKDTGAFKRFSSRLFYKLMSALSGLRMEEGTADFRLLDRKVVDIINDQPEADLFLRGYVSWLGFKQIGIPYVPAKRFSGSSKYTFHKMVAFASKGVTQFSIKPLRAAFIMASFAFVLSLVYVIYAIWASLTHQVVSGWLSLVVLLVFLQGIQFLLVGLVGEYVGRTFMQTKYRPEYIVAETNCEVDK